MADNVATTTENAVPVQEPTTTPAAASPAPAPETKTEPAPAPADTGQAPAMTCRSSERRQECTVLGRADARLCTGSISAACP